MRWAGSWERGKPRRRIRWCRPQMHYYDSRGVFRVYDVSIDERVWKISRDAEGFSQRFEGNLKDGGDTIDGLWQLKKDATWEDDLAIVYRRRK